MALTPSTMLDLGTNAPSFALPDVATANAVSLDDFSERKALLVIFLCCHCPYVIHVRDELARIARDYAGRDLAIVGIGSNDIEKYPDDSPEHLKRMAGGLGFPILFDETQEVAKAYTAACTPDFFLFDQDRALVYRGQLDDSRPSRGVPDGHDLRQAIDAALAGEPAPSDQKPSTGCNIKWKPGNEPEY